MIWGTDIEVLIRGVQGYNEVVTPSRPNIPLNQTLFDKFEEACQMHLVTMDTIFFGLTHGLIL